MIEEFSKKQIVFHTKLLYKNGYLEGEIVSNITSDLVDFDFECITVQGYELLNIMRNDTVGSKVKKTLSELGLKAFPILFSTAIQVIQNSIK